MGVHGLLHREREIGPAGRCAPLMSPGGGLPAAPPPLLRSAQRPTGPIGTVWLIRNPEGAKEPVTAFSAECPHLGCGVALSSDRKNFYCPCHTSAFDLEGMPKNAVPPRPMDRLEVELTEADDPEVRVKYQRFRTQTEEQILQWTDAYLLHMARKHGVAFASLESRLANLDDLAKPALYVVA